MNDINLNDWLFADIDDLIDCDYNEESDDENRMTDDEIIKTFECCIKDVNCEKCPAKDEDCFINRPQIALDLINRQKAEIEELKIENKSLRSAANCYKLHYNEARTEAYKEFAERLKDGAQMADCFDSYNMVVGTHFINNLLKEMIGE